MRERLFAALESVLAANKGGEVKNLLITDGNKAFLEDALYMLRRWVLEKGYNLVEIDEKEGTWLSEIQSRELFEKLNQPGTVLLIRNYATVLWGTMGENTPRHFLRDAAMHRHYGCGNDFVPSDDLPNLLFVVALNDLSRMYWKKEEYSLFRVLHEQEDKRLWVNVGVRHPATKMHPVMSVVNKPVCSISEDGKTLCLKVEKAFTGGRYVLPLYRLQAEERTEMLHTYLENNFEELGAQVDCLILKTEKGRDEGSFLLDAARLQKLFPLLGTVCCSDAVRMVNMKDTLYTLDPFELGELCFFLAQEGDFEMANSFAGDLWALDREWAEFWRRVAMDCRQKPETSPADASNGSGDCDDMDDLFKVYLLGWYSEVFPIQEEHKVYVKKHKNLDKAMELLPVRFRNCDLCAVSEKLYRDLQCVKNEVAPDYESFGRVLAQVEQLYPGVLDQMRKDGRIEDDELACLREWMMAAKKQA